MMCGAYRSSVSSPTSGPCSVILATSRNKDELLIFVTPKVLKEGLTLR